jgi:hypothetical protein
MINNHNDVHYMNIFAPIEPNLVNNIIPVFVNFDEIAINKPNATLKL